MAQQRQTLFTSSLLTNRKRDRRCKLCGGELNYLFKKTGEDKKPYLIYSCKDCECWQLNPLPSQEYLSSLYQDKYFKQRTKRGYANYLSPEVRNSIQSTFKKNLTDLGFFTFAKRLSEKKALEVGCAAGFFVEYLQELGWSSKGIDIASEMIAAGKANGLDLYCDDYLKKNFEEKFQLISFWATLEHLSNPLSFLKKMKYDLAENGVIYLSTCHLGLFAKVYGTQWRYLNVPEHLFYFSIKSLEKLAMLADLKLTHTFTYGSGLTARPQLGVPYSILKGFGDWAAKATGQGDMIVCRLEHLATD